MKTPLLPVLSISCIGCASLLLLSQCNLPTADPQLPTAPPPPAEERSISSEVTSYPSFKGTWNTAQGLKTDLSLIEVTMDGVPYGVIEGDIILGIRPEVETPKPGEKGLFNSGEVKPWPLAMVPYEFAPDFSNKTVAYAAIKEFETENTPVRFVQRTAVMKGSFIRYFITTDNSVGGGAEYGWKSKQKMHQVWINVDPAIAIKGVIVHELMHSLGFAHEQCRSDRDQWVTINKKNIVKDFRDQFDNPPLSQDIGPYDYKSIMHYHMRAFGIGDNPATALITIVPVAKPPSGKPFPANQLGLMKGFSKGDLASLQAMYGDEAKKRKALYGW